MRSVDLFRSSFRSRRNKHSHFFCVDFVLEALEAGSFVHGSVKLLMKVFAVDANDMCLLVHRI